MLVVYSVSFWVCVVLNGTSQYSRHDDIWEIILNVMTQKLVLVVRGAYGCAHLCAAAIAEKQWYLPVAAHRLPVLYSQTDSWPATLGQAPAVQACNRILLISVERHVPGSLTAAATADTSAMVVHCVPAAVWPKTSLVAWWKWPKTMVIDCDCNRGCDCDCDCVAWNKNKVKIQQVVQ